ncbi:glycosyltransferase family 4 protein [Vibrio alginolyticus]|nr:glycosyltransferase family 4 protein [Vibrio alginolyticus]
MKIGFFHDHVFLYKDGSRYTSGTLDSKLWERYLVRDIDQVVVCCRERQAEEDDILGPIASSEFVEFKPSPSLSSIPSLLFGFNHSFVKKVVEQVDYVVVRLPSEIGFVAAKYAKKLKKPVVCEVVGCPFDGLSGYGTLKAKVYAPIIKYRMKNVVELCDGALYVTERALQNKYPNKRSQNASNVTIKSINNGCVSHRLIRFDNKKIINIGLIGALDNDIKGVNIAIKALASIQGVKLKVLGKGDPSRFDDLAKKHGVEVSFDGFISEKNKILDWLDDIDIYIQPSFQEGLPRATIEAMSRGCIVASSNAGGLNELTLEQFIHSPGDYKKLSKDLTSIIHSTLDKKEDYIQHSLTQSSKYLQEKLRIKRTEFYNSIFNGQY